jgi:hypothetical protein
MTQEATSEAVWYVVHKLLIGGDIFNAKQVWYQLRNELAAGITIDPALVVRSLLKWEENGRLADNNYACIHVTNTGGEYKHLYHFRMYFPITHSNVGASMGAHRYAAEEYLSINANSTTAVLFHEGFLGVTTIEHPIGRTISTFTDPRGEGSHDLLLMAPNHHAEQRREYVRTQMHNWYGQWFPNSPLTPLDIDDLLKLPFPVPLALNISKKLAKRIHDRLLFQGLCDHLHYGEGEWKRLSKALEMFDWERTRWDDE